MGAVIMFVLSLAVLALCVALILVPFQILGVLRQILIELRMANLVLDFSDVEDDDEKAGSGAKPS
jgi:hypothetical protein